MAHLMLLSSSKIPRSTYLGYCSDELRQFLDGKHRLLFVPYAYPCHEEYTEQVSEVLGAYLEVVGAHTISPSDDLSRFDVVFCGGGNTFLLLKALYDLHLLERVKAAVANHASYIGSSAGANIACPTISTTNDMPIAYPPSFEALNLVPFNINPHYYENPIGFEHMGETRRNRIQEFQREHHRTVVALEEGAILICSDGLLTVRGVRGGRLFPVGEPECPIEIGDDLSFLLGMNA